MQEFNKKMQKQTIKSSRVVKLKVLASCTGTARAVASDEFYPVVLCVASGEGFVLDTPGWVDEAALPLIADVVALIEAL